jgi:ubiquinone/menaquinone biosynthesis C-methylase UbiE
MKLNLASGQMYLDGYINIDNMSMYNGSMKVDKQADIFTLDWEDNTVDEIILSHFAMYIELNQMDQLLKKWYGWLKPTGRIVIETGDVKTIAKYILETDDPDLINGSNGVMQLFGWESTKGHKWAWCEQTLGLSLFQAGFRNIETGRGYFHNNPIRDFLIIGTK